MAGRYNGAEGSIRRAEHADAAGILACLRAAFDEYRQSYTPPAFEDTVLSPAALRQRMDEMSLFVAVADDGEIVGTVGYGLVGRDEGHLRGMAVRPDRAGTGIAQRLLDTVEHELRQRRCSRLTLDTTAPLRRAIRFYERNGFSPSGVVRDFYGMPLFEYVKLLAED